MIEAIVLAVAIAIGHPGPEYRFPSGQPIATVIERHHESDSVLFDRIRLNCELITPTIARCTWR